MLVLNVYLDIVITAGASLAVLIAYSFIQFALGNRRYAVDYLIRNLWIPIVAVAVVSLALNMKFIADYFGVQHLYYFSYDYAIQNLDRSLTSIKHFYSEYITATSVAALGVGVADLILTIFSLGMKAVFDAILPVAQIVIQGLFAPAYVFSQIIFFLTFMYYLTIVLKDVSLAILGAGAVALPIPRVRRLGITLFIIGLILTYGLPYVINISYQNVELDISNYIDESGVLYVEAPPYALLNFSVTDGDVSGYAVYQVDGDGESLFVILQGNYTLKSITTAYATYPVKQNITFSIKPGLGKFFADKRDVDKYVEYLVENMGNSNGYSTPEEDWLYAYNLVKETVATDGDIWYVGYPYNYTCLNATGIYEELVGNDTYLMHNGKSTYVDVRMDYYGDADYTHIINDTSSTCLIASNGSTYGELDAYIITLSHEPLISVDTSTNNTRYVGYSYDVYRINSTVVYYGHGRRLNVTEVYGFYPLPKEYMEKLFNDYSNLTNIDYMKNITLNIIQYGSWDASVNYNDSLDVFIKYNNSNYEFLIYGGEYNLTKEDMVALHDFLNNLNIDYDKNYSLYLIHVHGYVNKHLKKIPHRINLVGDYTIDNNTITIWWNRHYRSYSYDNITSIENDTITYTYDNQTYNIQVNTSATINFIKKKIRLTWNDITSTYKYDELIADTHDYIKYYTYKHISEHLEFIIDPKPTNWHLFPYARFGTASKFIRYVISGGYLKSPTALAYMSMTGRMAYFMIYLTLLLMTADGIAVMFGGVSGIGFIGGKLYDKVFKAYVYQGLGIVAGIGQIAKPPYGKWLRTSLMKSERFRDWWNTLILRHGLLGHEATINIAKQKFGKPVGELTFLQRFGVAREAIKPRVNGMSFLSGKLKGFGLTALLGTTMVGRKAVHWLGASRGLGGYIDAAKDVVGSHHIRKWAMHPRYTEHRSAIIWRGLEKMENFKIDRWMTEKTQRLIEYIRDVKENIARLVQQKENFFINLSSIDIEKRDRLLPGLTILHIDVMNAWLHKLQFKLDRGRLRQYVKDYRYIEKKYVTRIGGIPQITGKVKPEDEEKYGNWLNFERYKDAMKIIHKSRHHIVNLDELRGAYNMAFDTGIIKKFNLDRSIWSAVNKFIKDETNNIAEGIRANKGRIPNVRDAYRFSTIQNLRAMRDARRHEHFQTLQNQFNINNTIWNYVYKKWDRFNDDDQEILIDYFRRNGEIMQDKRQYTKFLRGEALRIDHSLAKSEVNLVKGLMHIESNKQTVFRDIFHARDPLFIEKWGIIEEKGEVSERGY